MNTTSRSGYLKAKAVLAAVLFFAVTSPAQTITRQVLVSIPDCKLAYFENGKVVKVYAVAVGKSSTPSPVGKFQIVNRVTNPTYYHEGKVVTGPQNPVGTRWIGLSQKGYGIHGTNAPKSIGKRASHGCVRMGKKDLEELFEILRPGDEVEIRGERDNEMTQIFGGEAPVVVASAAMPAQGQ
jgi:lipoprotein-anchoring transpeptidase ErfK/SrfK